MKKIDQTARRLVLVIDDQDATRYVFRHSLSRSGFDVQEAETGADGLAQASLGPDIIICDVNLPDMLGYDVCRRLKSNPLTASIPVLQISASFVSDESKIQALGGGADAYLTQPVEPAVLIAQVNALLRLRRAEAVADLSARQWQSTFDSLSDGIALFSPNRTLIRTNRTFLDMCGLVVSEAEGIALPELFLRTFGLSFDRVGKRFEGGAAVELAIQKRWFRVRYNVIESDPQEDSGAILLMTEITDHKKLQETLKFNERLAATGRLAHTIAHEINNPLEAMSNLLYLAERAPSNSAEVQGYVSQASKELVRISEITKQVLAYHRESKEPIVTHADEIMDGVLAMFRSHIMGHKIDLESSLKCSSQIYVHPGEIQQVFSNMISNAIDAMGPEGGKLRIRCFDAFDQRSKRKGVRFFFSDSGTGIPERSLPNIFDAFFTTKGLKGSGVGLWLSAEILAKHAGSIQVRTRTAGRYRGTLFAIFLPLFTAR